MFVEESPILYANWVNSGVYPSLINIGTNIGAIIAHLADADPINRFINAETKTNRTIKGNPVNPILCRKSAPLTATKVPKFV